MERLHRTYGEKAYPKERMDGIWARVKDYSEAQFEKAITWVITENFTPPTLSKIMEALGSKGEQPQMQIAPQAFACEPCRDFGFGWIGETMVACTCIAGQRLSPQELARQQKFYDMGKYMFPMPGHGPIRFNLSRSLPYDPRESIAEKDGVRA